jgi:hypothetical protein
MHLKIPDPMAKRFTDPSKWERAWFRRLTPVQKCFVLFLFDRCDNAGVWVVDMETAEFFIGGDVGDPFSFIPDDFPVIPLCGGNKWFIPKFLSFQYQNGLNSKKPAIVSVVNMLARHGLIKKTNELFGNDFLTITESLTNDSAIVKDKTRQEKDNKGGVGENNVIDFDAIILINTTNLLESTIWLEQLAIAHKLTMAQLNDQLDAFITDLKLKKDARPLNELRNHFVNVVRKNAPVIRKNAGITTAPVAKSMDTRDELDAESAKHLFTITGHAIRFKDELTEEHQRILKTYWAGKPKKITMDAAALADKFSIQK